MKKLKLNLQHFEGAEVLTRSQLKKILGGVIDNGVSHCKRNTVCYKVGEVEYMCSVTADPEGTDTEICCCNHSLGNQYCDESSPDYGTIED